MTRIVKPFQWLRLVMLKPKFYPKHLNTELPRELRSSSIQTHSNSHCKSQVPDSLFCFSLWATRQRTDYTTALSISHDALQSPTAAHLDELHANFPVAQDVDPVSQPKEFSKKYITGPRFWKPSSAKTVQKENISSTNSIATSRKCPAYGTGKWRWQSSSRSLLSSFHCHNWHADISILSHPSREIHHGIVAISHKGKLAFTLSWLFTQGSVSMTTTSEYLPVSGFTLPSLHLSQQQKSFLTCLWHYPTVQVQVQTRNENMNINSHWKNSVSCQVCHSSFKSDSNDLVDGAGVPNVTASSCFGTSFAACWNHNSTPSSTFGHLSPIALFLTFLAHMPGWHPGVKMVVTRWSVLFDHLAICTLRDSLLPSSAEKR